MINNIYIYKIINSILTPQLSTELNGACSHATHTTGISESGLQLTKGNFLIQHLSSHLQQVIYIKTFTAVCGVSGAANFHLL